MALESKSNPLEEEEEEVGHENSNLHPQRYQAHEAAASYHPSAPPDELFDISTTVDPSYIISLIRKLVPNYNEANHRSSAGSEDHMDESGDQVSGSLTNEQENMDAANGCHQLASNGGEDGELSSRSGQGGVSAGEEVWEEFGCVLWDLAASRTHAQLMVQNLVLEVLMANLMASSSVRVTMTLNAYVKLVGLSCRLLTLGIQGGEYKVWAKEMQSEDILSRILWITENTLNSQLLEKSLGLLLAILEIPPEVSCVFLSSLMKLGLSSALINLFSFEMRRLTSERVPERYPVLDSILRAVETLSTLDGVCEQICSNKELFQLVCELVKLPDKVEVANSCVTAAVLIANILADVPHLAQEVSEARSALWSTIARVLVRVKENEMSLSSLNQYVLVLLSKSDLIEDDLLDQQLDNANTETKTSGSSSTKTNSRNTALQRIVCILNQWTDSVDCSEEDAKNIGRLLDCCCRFLKCTSLTYNSSEGAFHKALANHYLRYNDT
ncbi:hypothetical protein Tsubulata_010519 [Turnera subulata]|uniref:Uncharacterized protein n=1 Tax=Turnera subulata TaxID=218843 RepID=A0A9Q0G1R2_9ROSI|nr:hypothetical protein Tsubulata_010519 [Turnera subulata]